MSAMFAIRTQNVCKAHEYVNTLDGLTLTAEPGTVLGFLGPNGAGKTTTMRRRTDSVTC
jgi:ABC-type multidrug transport system ATPase subunit